MVKVIEGLSLHNIGLSNGCWFLMVPTLFININAMYPHVGSQLSGFCCTAPTISKFNKDSTRF
jgi:hypothetical protein